MHIYLQRRPYLNFCWYRRIVLYACMSLMLLQIKYKWYTRLRKNHTHKNTQLVTNLQQTCDNAVTATCHQLVSFLREYWTRIFAEYLNCKEPEKLSRNLTRIWRRFCPTQVGQPAFFFRYIIANYLGGLWTSQRSCAFALAVAIDPLNVVHACHKNLGCLLLMHVNECLTNQSMEQTLNAHCLESICLYI